MRRPIHSQTIAATLLLAAPAIASDDTLDPAARTIFNLRVASAVLESYQDAHGELPDLGWKPVPASRVTEALGAGIGPEWRKLLSARDGWGNALEFVMKKSHYMIISLGADGREDVPYAEIFSRNESPGREFEAPPDGPERDIVLADGALSQRPEPKRSPGQVAMSEIRAIGTAIEAYAVDNRAYPGPTSGLTTIDAFVGALEPIYIRTLPRVDPWGHPFLVWSDGEHYAVISAGEDGVLDVDSFDSDNGGVPDSLEPAGTADPDADIVFADGQFVKYPQGETPPGD